MTITEIDWTPDRAKLRSFSFILTAVCVLAGLQRAWRAGAFGVTPVGFHGPWMAPLVLWSVAVASVVVGLAAPRAMRPVYVGLMLAAFPVSWVVSHVLLGVTYYVVFTLFASVFRLIKRDALHRTLDRGATTYWITRGPARGPQEYLRQF